MIEEQIARVHTIIGLSHLMIMIDDGHVTDLVIAFKNRKGCIETSYFLPNDFGIGVDLCDALRYELIEKLLKQEEVSE